MVHRLGARYDRDNETVQDGPGQNFQGRVLYGPPVNAFGDEDKVYKIIQNTDRQERSPSMTKIGMCSLRCNHNSK